MLTFRDSIKQLLDDAQVFDYRFCASMSAWQAVWPAVTTVSQTDKHFILWLHFHFHHHCTHSPHHPLTILLNISLPNKKTHSHNWHVSCCGLRWELSGALPHSLTLVPKCRVSEQPLKCDSEQCFSLQVELHNSYLQAVPLFPAILITLWPVSPFCPFALASFGCLSTLKTVLFQLGGQSYRLSTIASVECECLWWWFSVHFSFATLTCVQLCTNRLVCHWLLSRYQLSNYSIRHEYHC